jgi:hypothetical protein
MTTTFRKRVSVLTQAFHENCREFVFIFYFLRGVKEVQSCCGASQYRWCLLDCTIISHLPVLGSKEDQMFQTSKRPYSMRSSSPYIDEKYGLNRIIATSAVALTTKRKYGDDRIPFCNSYGYRNIAFQITRSALLQSSLFTIEYNAFLEKSCATNEDIEFDWDAAQKKYLANFGTLAIRNTAVSILKHLYESLAVIFLSSKDADRLSKNLLKSMTRKLQRYHRIIACGRIFRTALYTGIPSNCSMLSVDIAFNIYDFIKYKKPKFNGKIIAVWFGKKVIFYSVCTVSSAAGYAFGSYFNHNYGGSLGAGVFEAAFSSIAMFVLQI